MQIILHIHVYMNFLVKIYDDLLNTFKVDKRGS